MTVPVCSWSSELMIFTSLKLGRVVENHFEKHKNHSEENKFPLMRLKHYNRHPFDVVF